MTNLNESSLTHIFEALKEDISINEFEMKRSLIKRFPNKEEFALEWRKPIPGVHLINIYTCNSKDNFYNGSLLENRLPGYVLRFWTLEKPKFIDFDSEEFNSGSFTSKSGLTISFEDMSGDQGTWKVNDGDQKVNPIDAREYFVSSKDVDLIDTYTKQAQKIWGQFRDWQEPDDQSKQLSPPQSSFWIYRPKGKACAE